MSATRWARTADFYDAMDRDIIYPNLGILMLQDFQSLARSTARSKPSQKSENTRASASLSAPLKPNNMYRVQLAAVVNA
jgi:hypothetical protein